MLIIPPSFFTLSFFFFISFEFSPFISLSFPSAVDSDFSSFFLLRYGMTSNAT